MSKIKKPLLTPDQLWNLIDLAFPVKTKGFDYTHSNGLIYCPSRGSQRYVPELREWCVDELVKLKAIVEAFGYSVKVGESTKASGAMWPIVFPTP